MFTWNANKQEPK